MKTGIFSIQPDKKSDPALVARRAEELGFGSYFVPDHVIFPVNYETKYPGNPGDGPDPEYLWRMPDPIVALTRAAAVTETLELGTGVLLVPERNPLHLAKEVASLDEFCDGRFLFGIGAGWCKEESEILGCDFPHRWTQVRECVEVMKACWTQEESEFHGKYYDVPPVRCFPKPARRPHPPILLPSIMLGGKWAQQVFRRMARWADGWLPVVETIEQLVDGKNQIEAVAREEGRDPDSLDIVLLGAPGQWRTRAEHKQLEKAGVSHVVLWLTGEDVDEIDREITQLAEELC